MYDVITFGSAIVDIFLQLEDLNLVSAVKEEKIEVDKRTICTGGGGTNSAVSFVRQGLNCAVVGRFGDDSFGEYIVKDLEKESISTDYVVQKSEQTDISVILLGTSAGRKILISRGKTRLEISNINWKKLDSKWFYITSLEGNLDLAEKLIGFAVDKNIKVSWNPGKRELENKKKIKSLAEKVEVFNLNRQEMQNLVDLNLEDTSFWQEVNKLGANLTLVTDGKEGAYLHDRKKEYFLPAPKTEVIDATGAGDAFGSGFVAGLIKGMDKKSAFGLAMKNGSSAVQYVGAKKGLLKNSKVQNFNTQN